MIALRNWIPNFWPDDRPACIPQAKKKPAAARLQLAGPRENTSRNIPEGRRNTQTRRRQPDFARNYFAARDRLLAELRQIRDEAASSAAAHLDCDLRTEGEQLAARAAALSAAIEQLTL